QPDRCTHWCCRHHISEMTMHLDATRATTARRKRCASALYLVVRTGSGREIQFGAKVELAGAGERPLANDHVLDRVADALEEGDLAGRCPARRISADDLAE